MSGKELKVDNMHFSITNFCSTAAIFIVKKRKQLFHDKSSFSTAKTI
jgi:hypothetical protein